MTAAEQLNALNEVLKNRNDLIEYEFDLHENTADGDHTLFDPELLATCKEWPSIKCKWLLDLNDTSIETLDSGIDMVGGNCNTSTISQLVDSAFSENLIKSPFFQRHNLVASDYVVFDNGSPDCLALLKKNAGIIQNNVFLIYSSYPGTVFDLQLTTDSYLKTGTAAGFIFDWQLAVLGIKKYGTESILHYHPQLFNSAEQVSYINALRKKGLTVLPPTN